MNFLQITQPPPLAMKIVLPLIVAVSVAMAYLSTQSLLFPVGLWLTLAVGLILIWIKPRPLEMLFFLIPMFEPTLPAVTGLSSHFTVLAFGWTGLFLFYWIIQSLSGAWNTESIRTPFIYPLVIYRILFTVSIFHPLHKNALNYTLQSLILIAVYWILVQCLEGQNYERLLKAVIWGAIISSLVFLVAFSIGTPKFFLFGLRYGIVRPIVLDTNANAWAWSPLVGMPLAMTLIVQDRLKRFQFIAILSGMFLMLATALICNSRSSLVAIMGSTLFIIITHRKALKRSLVAIIALLPILLIVIPGSWGLIQSFMRVKTGLSGRVEIWKLALEYIINHPLTGIGPGWFADRIVVDAPPLKDGVHAFVGKIGAHNAFLMTATDIGIFAVLPLLFIIGFYAWRARRLWNRLSGGPDFPLLVAICATMIAGVLRSCFETDFIFLHGYVINSLVLLILLAFQDRLYAREFASA